MNAIDLRGRKAVITGGAGGLGEAIGARFAASGAAVSLWDLDAAAAAAVANRVGAKHVQKVDVTQAGDVEQAAAAAEAALGGIDILVTAAGATGANQRLEDTSPEAWRWVIELNLTGTFLCCRAAVPRMRRGGYGRIINIASIAGKEGNANQSGYSASKAGVIALTKSLAKELADTEIRVNAVVPAVIETQLLSQMSPVLLQQVLTKIPLGRAGRPHEVAAMVAWLTSEECSFSTGATFDLSGGRATY
jgi:3-oxoacyl-[acyl-carrier protein] reductase